MSTSNTPAMSVDDSLLSSMDNSDIQKSKTYKIAFLVTFPVFCSYASCFSLQRHLSFVFGLTEGVSGDHLSFVYGIGTSFVYFFNLIFRVFGHNICFGFLAARDRVWVSLLSSTISMSILTILCFVKTTPHISWVFIAYSFCGVCEGSFGPNMLNVASHLGETRYWVVLAMPFGVGFISLVAFASIALGCPFWIFYIFSGSMSIVAIFVYLFTIYPASKAIEGNEKQFDLHQFCQDLLEIKKWFPTIWVHSTVFIFDMICLALFNPGATLYAYDSRVTFRLFGNLTIDHDWFIFLYNIGSFFGDFLARKVMDKRRLIHPLWFLIMIFLGAGLNLCLIPEIAPFAGLLFMWANGSLYTQSTRYIEDHFPNRYHLTATSTWLFIGDVGSTCGSNIVQPSRSLIVFAKSKMF